MLSKRHQGEDLRKVVVARSKADGEVRASESFMFLLYGGVSSKHVAPMEAQPSWRLAELLRKQLPGWERIFHKKWTAAELIAVTGNILDAAFLNMVHMYKAALGDRLPKGVFD